MSRFILLIATLMLGLTPALALAAEKPSTFKDEVSTTVVDTVDATKEFFSGIADGIEKAGQDPPKFDPSHIAANKADLARLLKVEIVKLEDLENGKYLLTVALRNTNGFPVRVTGLGLMGHVVLLDKDGFSYPLPNPAEQERDLTVLARSASRLKFTFTGVEARPAIFRLFDTDFSIPRW